MTSTLLEEKRGKYEWGRADSIRTSIAAVIIVLLLVLSQILESSQTYGSPAATSLLIGTALGIAFERGRFCIFCIFRDSINQSRNYGLISIFTALAVGSIVVMQPKAQLSFFWFSGNDGQHPGGNYCAGIWALNLRGLFPDHGWDHRVYCVLPFILISGAFRWIFGGQYSE